MGETGYPEDTGVSITVLFIFALLDTLDGSYTGKLLEFPAPGPEPEPF